ncbi:MAG: hypothetical protein NZM26_02545 [Patescibacteria group bacterium]|nr:hypothetical protein [Patescibacteria group bacterium]
MDQAKRTTLSIKTDKLNIMIILDMSFVFMVFASFCDLYFNVKPYDYLGQENV